MSDIAPILLESESENPIITEAGDFVILEQGAIIEGGENGWIDLKFEVSNCIHVSNCAPMSNCGYYIQNEFIDIKLNL